MINLSEMDPTLAGQDPSSETDYLKGQQYPALPMSSFPPQRPPQPLPHQIRSPMVPPKADQNPTYANQASYWPPPLASSTYLAPGGPITSAPLQSASPQIAGATMMMNRPPSQMMSGIQLTSSHSQTVNQSPSQSKPDGNTTTSNSQGMNMPPFQTISGAQSSDLHGQMMTRLPFQSALGVRPLISQNRMIATPPHARPLSQPTSVVASQNRPKLGSFLATQTVSTQSHEAITGRTISGQVASNVNVSSTYRPFLPSGHGIQSPIPGSVHVPPTLNQPAAIVTPPLPRGPPMFGLSQANFKSPPVVNETSNRSLSQGVTSYRPSIPVQTSSVGLVAAQPGLHSSQYSQYVGQPPMTLDKQTIRDPSYPSPCQAVQNLVEEFQSMSMITSPGSMEGSIDPNSLPRPSGKAEHPIPSLTINCSSRYIRLTSGSLPNSQSLAARWHLPIGAVVHPLAKASLSDEVPLIDFGPSGIVRCRRCRAYINPYAVFIDNGRRWRCNLCSLNNDVPSEYYCPLDQNGRRKDADERLELCQGSVEFIAPAEYMVAVDTIYSCLDKLPGYPKTQIGFLTFDSTLHFYNLKSSLTQPQMMVVADLDDPFLPIPDDLLVNLSESRPVVEALLNSIPSMFKENTNVESAAGPALRAAFMIMSKLGGKLMFFQSSLPSLGFGRLKIRGDDPRLYGSDKEALIRNPEDPFYKQMGADFSKFQISVSVYAFSDSYIDLASLGTLAKYTAGQVYFYPFFQSHVSAEKFSYELSRDLTRETAWEAVLRIRCGKGMRFNTYHGHFLLRSSDLMALPAFDCDKVFAMQLKLEESLLTSQTTYLQAVLLYTSSNGERRIRIHTLAVPLTSDLNEIYRKADTGAIVMLMSRIAVERSLTMKLDDVKQQYVQSKLVLALREYQNMYGAQHSLTGRLIYPESLKLLPLYCLSLSKCLALSGSYTGVTLDERLFAGFEMMIMSVPRLLNFLYPTMFQLDECLKGGGDVNSVRPLPLTARILDSRAVFLINNGLRFIIWLGSAVLPEFSAQLLGVEAVKTADLSKVVVLEQKNNLSKKFMTLLESFRANDPSTFGQCVWVRQGDPREAYRVLLNLVEDSTNGSLGYVDWMIQIFRQVKQKV